MNTNQRDIAHLVKNVIQGQAIAKNKGVCAAGSYQKLSAA